MMVDFTHAKPSVDLRTRSWERRKGWVGPRLGRLSKRLAPELSQLHPQLPAMTQ